MSKGGSYSEKGLTLESSILKEQAALKFLTLVSLKVKYCFLETWLGQEFIL